MKITKYAADPKVLSAIAKKGAQWLAVQKHSIGGREAGELISWHRSHVAACRAAGPSQFTEVMSIEDAQFYSWPSTTT